ncbi:hypothetical protein DSO57_1027046 [Entomophthora muscae]|uniref:Uncharacterized protein n=1 Tax=Entomophthora muscae TaxID=34485 RepID=A0ACC2UNU9_9FUNG|nr:hypothetical protein DSO57_1027046 [Entomophthora muscae]
MGFEKSTVAATLQAHANCDSPPKKTPTGSCTSTEGDTTHPLMMVIMERDPQMPLVQVCLQLGLHNIFTNKRTVNFWMHRVVVAARILFNQFLGGPSLVDTEPFNSTIFNFVKGRAMMAHNVVIFLLYTKILASIQDFGEKRIQLDIYKGGPILYSFVGVLLAVSPLVFNHKSPILNTAYGYAYQTELKAMLKEWATQKKVYTIVLSAEMEQREWASKEIVAIGHTCWGNCGKFDSLVIDFLVLDTFSSTRELSATYVNLLEFLDY